MSNDNFSEDDFPEDPFEASVADMLQRRALDVDSAAAEHVDDVIHLPSAETPGGARRIGPGVLAAAAVAVLIVGLVVWGSRSDDGAELVADDSPGALDRDGAVGSNGPILIMTSDGQLLSEFDSDLTTEVVSVPVGGAEAGAAVVLGEQIITATDDYRVELVRRILMGCEAHVDPALAAHLAEAGRAFLDPDGSCRSVLESTSALGSTDEGATSLRVFTTFDETTQPAATSAVTEILPADERGFAMALVSVDPASGAVRTIAGAPGLQSVGVLTGTSRPGYQPGSAFKVVVAAAAFEAGFVPEDLFDGRGPCEFEIEGLPDEPYRVENFGGSQGSVASITDLLIRSSNCGAVRIAERVGVDQVVDLARRLGLSSGRDDSAVISLALGTATEPPVSMASAMATLVNGGVRNDLHIVERVETLDGAVLYERSGAPRQVIDPVVACRTLSVLEANVRSGTGTRAAIDNMATAGKSGTTENFTSAWFVGTTPSLSTAVWMGYPHREGAIPSMSDVGGLAQVTGGSYPAQAFGQFHRQLPDEGDVGSFGPCPPSDREPVTVLADGGAREDSSGAESLTPVRGVPAATLVPPGYEILSETFGVLDGDEVEDAVLVLRSVDEQVPSELPRPVLLLRGVDGGGFELAARSDRIVLCSACGGAKGSFGRVAIKDRYFSFEQHGGSREAWFRVTTFRLNPTTGEWELTGDASEVIDTLVADAPVETVQHSGNAEATFQTFDYTR